MIKISTVVGVVLWWAEGSKSRRDKRWKNAVTYPMEMTSTDPLAVKLFLKLVREDFEVEEKRIKQQIQIHENDDREYLEEYWSKITKIPKTRFNRTIVRPQGNKVGKSRGTCKIRFNDKVIYLKARDILKRVLNECNIDLK